MKNTISKLKLIFTFIYDTFILNEIDSKLVRRRLSNFFYIKASIVHLYFTEVKVYENKSSITVKITTHRVGLLIGKSGHFIDELIEYLNDELKDDYNKEIKIDIKESKMWYNLY